MKRKIPQVLFYILSVICLALCISGGVILNRENHEHVAEFVPAAAPTCAVEGNIEHWRCRECGLRFKDELMLEEIAAADTVIETLPHTEETIQGTPATCTQTGLSDGRRCTTCNNVTVEQTITPTIPHTEETIQGTPATCTQTGLSDGKRCTVCNNITKQQTVIPTLPHSEEYVKGFASTCVKTGLTDGRRCTVCHTITLEQTEIPLIPHNETIIKGTPATCTQTGISDGKRCTLCRAVTVEQTVLALIAHTPAHMEETQSTCAKRGNIEFWKCGSCKNSFAEEACVTKLTEDEIYKPLAAHPYKLCFDDTRHFKLPTCGHDAEEKDGAEHTYDGRTCTDCGFCNYGVVYTLNTDGLSYSVTDLKSTANRDEIEVYAEYGGLPVTEIAQNAFNTEHITALTLPDSITKICKGAIDNCNYLTALHVPKNATLIQGAVTDCYSLEELTVAAENASYVSVNNCIIHKSSKTLILGCKNSIIPANGSVTKIGDYAFEGCAYLYEISIPDCVTSIGDYAFKDCTNITEISIPDSVTTIGNYAFYSCNLLNLNIADGVKNIGNYAFRYCSKLTQITLPESVKSIGSYAFSNCTSLTTISIPASVETIGSSAFENCVNLSEINLQSGVTRINANAFKNCKSLKKVNFPASVEYIASDAFINCGGLEELTVEAGNINYSGVNNCIIDKRSDTLILGCKNSVIPSDGSVTSIGEYAFRGCTQLISIHIPASVTTIAGGAFTGMTSLGEITVAPENSNYYVKDNCLIEKSSKTLVLGCKGSIVPTDGSVTKIGNYAFDGCIELTDITIPKSLTHIGISAFNNTDVKNLYLEDLESWLKVIFRNADGVYPCSPLQNGGNIYVNGELLTEFTVPDGIDEIPRYAFYNCLSLTKIVIPNHVKEVNSAFYGCANVNEIIVGDGITDWNYYSSFKKLKTITLGKGITEIRTNAFLSLTQLSSVTLGENITEIGSNAFMRCSSLTQLTLNKNLQTIGNNAFRLCSGLTEIELPDSLQSLGSYVFSNCTSLTTVTIPQGVDKLYSTFRNCTALKDIYFKGTREQWEAIPKSNWDYGAGEYTIHFIDGTTLNKGEA